MGIVAFHLHSQSIGPSKKKIKEPVIESVLVYIHGRKNKLNRTNDMTDTILPVHRIVSDEVIA